MLEPQDWHMIDGLVAGFGDRRTAAPQGLSTVVQVHGAKVVSTERLARATSPVEADSLVTTSRGAVAAVRTADCVPILLVAEAARPWAAAVHAGWRGLLAGVLEATVAVATEAGHSGDRLFAALGPAIGACCYGVGPELAARFEDLGHSILGERGRPRLDLRAVARTVLVREGLSPERIQLCGPCTCCRSDLYHSYRRCPSDDGRQLSWIGWQPPAASSGPRARP